MRDLLERPLVSVVITTRNRKDDVLGCLDSIYKLDYPNLEVLLVDNGSTDGTSQEVGEKYPSVKKIVAEENLGIVGGRNAGQKEATGKYIFFLDSDTILDQSIITESVNFMESDPKIGIAAPKIYSYKEPNRIWYAGAILSLLTSQAHNIGAWEIDKGQHDQIRDISHSPTAFLVRRDVAEKVGGHDEIYFMSYGDADFGFKVREAGFLLRFLPTAKMWHKVSHIANIKSLRQLGFETPLRAYYFARNKAIFMRKRAPLPNFLFFFIFLYPLFTLWYVVKILQYGGREKFLRPYLEGSWDATKFVLGKKIQYRRYQT